MTALPSPGTRAMLREPPPADGHRCRYAYTEGSGPRGGRRTWTRATCVGCGASAQVQDARPGSRDAYEARGLVVHSAPTCPAPELVAPAARSLEVLARGIGRRGEAAPSVEWQLGYNPDGEPDPDRIVQAAWRHCPDPAPMCALFGGLATDPAPGRPGRALCFYADEARQSYHARFRLHRGPVVELVGEPAEVADALRALVPRAPWRPEGP